MYLVKYEVEGRGPQQAGPFSHQEANYQLKDIMGYEGVSNAHLVWCDTSTGPAKIIHDQGPEPEDAAS